MEQQSFKERVAEVAIEQAKIYQSIFLDYEYLLCSDAFVKHDYYIIAATKNNYRHLIGVNTSISADEFFEKCINCELSESDFDFIKPGRSEKEIKGSVRRKIKALPFFMKMIDSDLVAQEDYQKNGVVCSFATTDCNMTIGFIDSGKSRPKSLLWGDSLDWGCAGFVELILRRKPCEQLFSEIVVGDDTALLKYKDKISDIISPELMVRLSAPV